MDMRTYDKRIFIVDDEQKVRAAVASTLSELGFEVSCFADGSECLKELSRRGCDLLICDLRMPKLDGMTLLARVKCVTPWVPVILLTGYGDVQLAVRAMKLGAADFVQKPFDRKAFVGKIKAALDAGGFEGRAAEHGLTKTERKVLKMVLEGKGSKEIALKFGRAVRTIEFHRTHIMQKFGVSNVVELMREALVVRRKKRRNNGFWGTGGGSGTKWG